MKEAIKISHQGLKCDNPNCDYEENTVTLLNKNLIGKPCPKCGQSLLTENDYHTLKVIYLIVKIINILLWPFMLFEKNPNTSYKTVKSVMDGSGRIQFEEIQDKD